MIVFEPEEAYPEGHFRKVAEVKTESCRGKIVSKRQRKNRYYPSDPIFFRGKQENAKILGKTNISFNFFSNFFHLTIF